MHRIMRAVNGRYYVQKQFRFGWSRVSPFYYTRAECRSYIDRNRYGVTPRVVEYY